MDIESLEKRERDLIVAHEKISSQITNLLDHRIKIVGAIEENKYQQKQFDTKEKNENEVINNGTEISNDNG